MKAGSDIWVVGRLVFWLDADTLVFPGYAASDGRDADRDDPTHLYLWKPEEGSPQIYKADFWPRPDPAWRDYFCASDGELRYAFGPPRLTETAGQFEYHGMVGPPGQERATVFRSFRPTHPVEGGRESHGLTPTNDIWSVWGRLVGARCEEDSDPRMIGKAWAADYDRSHRIVFDQTDLTFSNARLETAGGNLISALPISEGLAMPSCVHALPWSGRLWMTSCLVAATVRIDDPEAAYFVWEIAPQTGAIDETKIAVTPISFGLEAIPTKAGLFLISESGGRNPNPGLYAMTDGREILKIPGRFGNAYVSPDGCKVALTSGYAYQTHGVTLVVVNVCRPRNAQNG